jgi:CheY-like chemotaxis protein
LNLGPGDAGSGIARKALRLHWGATPFPAIPLRNGHCRNLRDYPKRISSLSDVTFRCRFVRVPPLVLVVEDEPVILRVTCHHLEDAGFECVNADTATHALAVLAQTVPDLLVLDIRLPDIPGPELALRVHGNYPTIPVLFVSGWIDGLAEAATLEPLRWEFLQKPFTGEALVAAARRLLEKPLPAIH